MFLQELFEQGASFSTLKVYMAAISAGHVGIDGAGPEAHPLAVQFRQVSKPIAPTWDFAFVVDALC